MNEANAQLNLEVFKRAMIENDIAKNTKWSLPKTVEECVATQAEMRKSVFLDHLRDHPNDIDQLLSEYDQAVESWRPEEHGDAAEFFCGVEVDTKDVPNGKGSLYTLISASVQQVSNRPDTDVSTAMWASLCVRLGAETIQDDQGLGQIFGGGHIRWDVWEVKPGELIKLRRSTDASLDQARSASEVAGEGSLGALVLRLSHDMNAESEK